MKKYDVVVIGAGIAGLYISKLLSKYNLSICLLDAQNDINKVPFHTLGSFLNLEDHGLSKKCIASKVTNEIFHSKHIRFKTSGIGYVLNKEQIHKEIHEGIRGRVSIINPVNIVTFSKTEDNIVEYVQDAKRRKYYGEIFIDCSGVTGVLTKELGLQDKKIKIAKGVEYNVEYLDDSDKCHLFIGKSVKGGYAWIFPFGGQRAIFGYGALFSENFKDCEEILEKLFYEEPYKSLVIKDNNDLSSGIIPITEVKNKFVRGNTIGIGDSVSQVNPLVGEGYRFIMEAAQCASPYILKAIKQKNLPILKKYEKDWNEKFLATYTRCKELQKFAYWASTSDVKSDLALLILATKRDKTMAELLAAKVTIRNLLLP